MLSDKPPEAWRAMLNSYGFDHQITRLGENSTESQEIWGRLPGIYWSHSVAKIKPAARVLLENENPSRQTLKGEKEPLMALQMYGSGPVLYMGTDDTWRWRPIEDAKYHKRFWNNVISFLATLEMSRVIITTGGDTFNVGDKIKVEAEAYDKEFKPITDPTFTVQVVDASTGKVETELVLAQVKGKEGEAKSGRYSGVYTSTHRGNIEITVNGQTGIEAKRFSVKVPEVEALRSEANEEVMKSMVSRPDDFLHVWEMDKLVDRIPPGKQVLPYKIQKYLWDTPLVLGTLMALLMVEWIFRKKFNMT